MRELPATELLEIWERGWAQPPSERALTLLRRARPDLETEALADLSIGRRDGLLLSLRETIFGPRLASITSCPDCREQLELGFDVDQVRLAQTIDSEPVHCLAVDDFEVTFRLPNSRDLAVASAAVDIDSARQSLIGRCVLSTRSGGQVIERHKLPPQILDRVEEEMAQLDAQANIQVELECPSCRRGWTAAFDILAFFWSELDAWAQRLLVEVHKLAAVYGWREKDILAMGATRRGIYLNLING